MRWCRIIVFITPLCSLRHDLRYIQFITQYIYTSIPVDKWVLHIKILSYSIGTVVKRNLANGLKYHSLKAGKWAYTELFMKLNVETRASFCSITSAV
jgi:hypothetical protein